MKATWLQRVLQWFGGSSAGADAQAPPGTSGVAEEPRIEAIAPREAPKPEGVAEPPRDAPKPTAPKARATKPRGATDVVMGLDFGTSCTKVVIQTPFLGGGRALAVPFDDSLRGIGRFLAPTAVGLGADGEIRLEQQGRAGGEWRSLKVDLMERPDSPEPRALAAGYLAQVIRRARARYLESEKRNLEGFDLRWEMNLGIPSAGYDDAVVRSSFMRAARAAWVLANSDGPIRFQKALELENTELDLPAIDVIPEVAAEVVGYARSSFRRTGLHLLVDVGASTVDVCGFILDEREGDMQYALLTALVEQRGAHELHRARLAEIERAHPGILSEELRTLDLSAPTVSIPGSISSYVTASGFDHELALIEGPLIAGCREQVMRCVKHLKKHRDPNAPEWTTGLRVFLCGGGALVDAYRAALDDASASTLAAGWAREPLVIGPLPLPPRLENPRLEADFQRLAVAYGLSFSRIDIGTILPPEQIPDVPPRMRRAQQSFVSMDQV